MKYKSLTLNTDRFPKAQAAFKALFDLIPSIPELENLIEQATQNGPITVDLVPLSESPTGGDYREQGYQEYEIRKNQRYITKQTVERFIHVANEGSFAKMLDTLIFELCNAKNPAFQLYGNKHIEPKDYLNRDEYALATEFAEYNDTHIPAKAITTAIFSNPQYLKALQQKGIVFTNNEIYNFTHETFRSFDDWWQHTNSKNYGGFTHSDIYRRQYDRYVGKKKPREEKVQDLPAQKENTPNALQPNQHVVVELKPQIVKEEPKAQQSKPQESKQQESKPVLMDELKGAIGGKTLRKAPPPAPKTTPLQEEPAKRAFQLKPVSKVQPVNNTEKQMPPATVTKAQAPAKAQTPPATVTKAQAPAKAQTPSATVIKAQPPAKAQAPVNGVIKRELPPTPMNGAAKRQLPPSPVEKNPAKAQTPEPKRAQAPQATHQQQQQTPEPKRAQAPQATHQQQQQTPEPKRAQAPQATHQQQQQTPEPKRAQAPQATHQKQQPAVAPCSKTPLHLALPKGFKLQGTDDEMFNLMDIFQDMAKVKNLPGAITIVFNKLVQKADHQEISVTVDYQCPGHARRRCHRHR